MKYNFALVRVLYVNVSIKWAAPSEGVFEHAQNAQIQIHPTHAQSLIRAFPLHWYILMIIPNDFAIGQRRSWSDCADVQADLGLQRSHVPEDTLLQGEAEIRWNCYKEQLGRPYVISDSATLCKNCINKETYTINLDTWTMHTLSLVVLKFWTFFLRPAKIVDANKIGTRSRSQRRRMRSQQWISHTELIFNNLTL